MAKSCHLVVKPSKNCIDQSREYSVSERLDSNPSATFNISTNVEMFNSDTKNTSVYGDITGCIIRTDNGAENNPIVYFSVKNPQVGWPWAVMSNDNHLERYVTHKLDEDESFTFTSDDGIKFTLERLDDTKSKEFVIWVDV